jgi:hypothetical protein
MPLQATRNIFTPFVIALVSATIALAQSSVTAIEIPVSSAASSWVVAQSVGATKGKLIVVTIDKPNRRQACRIQSFTLDKLVCSRSMGAPRTFLPQQVAALIVPGDGGYKTRFVLGANAVMAGAIWGTVVLAPTCPVCAAATGVVALGCFLAAGAVLIGDDQPDRLLYLAPGQHLSGKLRFVQPYAQP